MKLAGNVQLTVFKQEESAIYLGQHLATATLKDGTRVGLHHVGNMLEVTAGGKNIYIKYETVIQALLDAGLIEGSDT